MIMVLPLFGSMMIMMTITTMRVIIRCFWWSSDIIDVDSNYYFNAKKFSITRIKASYPCLRNFAMPHNCPGDHEFPLAKTLRRHHQQALREIPPGRTSVPLMTIPASRKPTEGSQYLQQGILKLTHRYIKVYIDININICKYSHRRACVYSHVFASMCEDFMVSSGH